MKISIFGTGYVGLVTGASLAKLGHEVFCIDKNKSVIDNLNNSKTPFYEKGLDSLLNETLNVNLTIGEFDEKIVANSEIILITVGTPSTNLGLDLSFIDTVVRQIGDAIKNDNVCNSIVIKSTVLPKTTDTHVKDILENEFNLKHTVNFGLGMNPEFLREGDAVDDFLNPDRIVIGYEDNITKDRLEELYEVFECKKIFVNTRTAELIKYVNNSLLATQIAIHNEFSNIARKTGGIDYKEIIEGVVSDKRWSIQGSNETFIPSIVDYFQPGYGYGGSCFPKDVKALLEYSKGLDSKSLVLDSVIKSNDLQPLFVEEVLRENIDLKDKKKILILGTSFKPETDDIRESSSIKIVEICSKLNLEIYIHDPLSQEKFIDSFKTNLIGVKDWKNEISIMDIILISTSWLEYKLIEDLYKDGLLDQKVIIDGRGFLDNKIFKNNYFSVGSSKNS
jgi:UDPglucose 6-dehydrogenase/GDP-mannose 6-dehydrogenase